MDQCPEALNKISGQRLPAIVVGDVLFPSKPQGSPGLIGHSEHLLDNPSEGAGIFRSTAQARSRVANKTRHVTRNTAKDRSGGRHIIKQLVRADTVSKGLGI